MWRGTTLALAVASLAGLGTVPAHADEHPKPAIDHDFADPGVLRTPVAHRTCVGGAATSAHTRPVRTDRRSTRTSRRQHP